MSIKNKVIDHIIKVEGGYVNDSADSGGATKYGITEKVARANGYTGSMQAFPRDLAVDIYGGKYWDVNKLDQVEAIYRGVAREIADTGVNMGPGRAAKILQRALTALNNGGRFYPDLVVDGAIGPGTLGALQAYADKRGIEGGNVLLCVLNCLQGAYYVDLVERREKDERFLYGWLLNRVFN